MESIHEPRRNRLIIRGGVFRNFEPNSPEKPPRFAVRLPAFSKASVSPDVVCYGVAGEVTRHHLSLPVRWCGWAREEGNGVS